MTASNPVYVLNWDSISELMHLGARRASSFMALGLRSANDDTVRSVQLGGLHSFRFANDPLTEDESKDVRHNFSHWIIGNGFRELEMFFNRTMDIAYEYYIVISKGEMTYDQLHNKTKKFFGGTNSAKKLTDLMGLLSAKATLVDHIVSLSKARNVLTHNFGIVDNQAGLVVRWRGMDITIDGVVIPDAVPFRIDKAGELRAEFLDRVKTFDRGQSIELTPRDLHEICLTYIGQTDEVIRSLVEYARSKGFIVNINTPKLNLSAETQDNPS